MKRRLGTRLAISYVLLAAAIVAVFTVGTGTVLFLQMRGQIAHFAVQDIETVEGLLAFNPDGRVVMRDDYHNHPESKRVLDHYVEVLDPTGVVLYRNEQLGSDVLGSAPSQEEGVGGYSQRFSRLKDGTRVVLVSRRHILQGMPVLIRLAQSEEPAWRALKLFAIAAALMFAIVIGVAAIAALRMSRQLLAPIQNIAARAEQITSQHLHERIPSKGTGDEIDQLAESFNRTLTRLDESFRQLRQFTSDASHELRTPLAAIRAIGEVGLDHDGTAQEYRDLIGSMLEEVSRLTHLVNDLLMISQGDAGSIRLNRTNVRLIDLVRDTISLLEPLADEKDQKLEFAGDADAVVPADAVLLRQALINVVENAIKYSPPRSTTLISVQDDGPDSVVITVRDEGPGIAPEHIPHIFDRFYRVDSGRSRKAGGFGLGLAISQWAVAAHDGSIRVTSAPGAGASFTIDIPRPNHVS
jgi:heavy metal sensor kinase